jgi:hypothetical protein
MKQIGGLCYPLVKTIDDLVFYKLCDEYYARKKSTLSGKRVKSSPEFKRTMLCASLLVRASRIGAVIYNALPPGWRQFWMYRSFTGEALILLQDNSFSDEEVKALLQKCYVEYWEQRKAVDPDNPIFQPRPKKIRTPRKYSEESIQRMLKRKGKDGKPKWRDPEEEERKRLRKAMNDACYERTMEKQEKMLQQAKQSGRFKRPDYSHSIPDTPHRQPIRKILCVPSYIRKGIKKPWAPRKQFETARLAPPIAITAERMKTTIPARTVTTRQRRKAARIRGPGIGIQPTDNTG